MTQFQCSDKLSKYLRKVELETGRSIELRLRTGLGLAGTTAAFSLHPSSIIILLNKGIDWGSPEHESSIAHEATHGYLIYKLGYSYITEKRKPAKNEKAHVRLLITMIDDIVVNKIVQDEGFPPFAPAYLEMLETRTKAARNGSDRPYDMFSHDPFLKDRFMVFSYILAWGLINYCDLKPHARKTIAKYLKEFQKSFANHFAMADQIRKVILQQNIFTPHGHRKTIEAVARLWHLDDLVGLQST